MINNSIFSFINNMTSLFECISIDLPVELTNKFDMLIIKQTELTNLIKWNANNEKVYNKLINEKINIQAEIIGIYQFIISKYASDKYKLLSDPVTPIINSFSGKVKFIIAENHDYIKMERLSSIFSERVLFNMADSMNKIKDKL